MTPNPITRGGQQVKKSLLESLPNELLEMIFFYCLNIGLPRASTSLGLSLSSFHIKARLFHLVFSSDEPQELTDILHTEPAIARLQTDILASRWMTLGFFRDYVPKSLEKWLLCSLSDSVFERVGLHVDTETISHLIRMFHERTGQPTNNGDREDLFYKWRLSDEAQIMLAVNLFDGEIYIIICVDIEDHENYNRLDFCFRYKLLQSLQDCRIPEKLLRGPWTSEKCELLDVIKRSGATIDWIGSTAGEVASQGLLSAIQENNPVAIRSLLSDPNLPHPLESEPSVVQFARHQIVYGSPPDFDFTLPPAEHTFPHDHVHVIPRTQHLRAAVIDLNCPPAIVELLLLYKPIFETDPCGYPEFQIDFGDPQLRIWALKRKSEGDLRGAWLLRILMSRGGWLGDFKTFAIPYEREFRRGRWEPGVVEVDEDDE